MRKKSARVFYDIQKSEGKLLSIGMVASTGQEFYGEITEYEGEPNDIPKDSRYLLRELGPFEDKIGSVRYVKGTDKEVHKSLHKWFRQFSKIHVFGNEYISHNDFIDITGGTKFKDIELKFFGLDTQFHICGISHHIDKEAFIDTPVEGVRHSALYNAAVMESCYDKLHRNKERYMEMQKDE